MLHLQHKNYLLAEQDFDKILEVNEKSVKGRLGHAILEKLRGITMRANASLIT